MYIYSTKSTDENQVIFFVHMKNTIAEYEGFMIQAKNNSDMIQPFAGIENNCIQHIRSHESLMFQTGYLTIKKTSTIFNQLFYTLCYPNFEVKNAFHHYLIGYFTDSKEKRNIASFEWEQV